MPSDLTISKLKGTTTPTVSTREQEIAASHRKVGDLVKAYPNIWGDNDLEEIRKVSQQAKAAAFGMPAALIGGAADLTGMATAVVYNTINMARGEEWAWPEDFRNVPATSDWWGAQMGLTKEQTDSLAFIGGGVALSPTKALDEKLISKALKVSKTFQGSRKIGLQNKKAAEKLLAQGASEDEIWKQTGWWPFTDDAGNTTLKFYVSDADAVIKYDKIGEIARRQYANENLQVGGKTVVNTTLAEAFDHPALYELYPEIAGYPIQLRIEKVGEDTFKLAKPDGTTLASFNRSSNQFKLLGSQGNADARESILHEVQHAIQTLEGWPDGAATETFRQTVQNWRASDLMRDIATNPDSYLDWDEEMLVSAFGKALGTSDADQIRTFTRQAENIIASGMEPDPGFWATYVDRFANEARRWLSTAIHIDGNFDNVMANLSDRDLETLATLRYKLDLGEMEARLTQALSDIPQETFNKFVINPHKLSRYLSGKQLEKLQKEVPEAKKMSFNVGFDEAVTEASVGKIQERGLVDLQNIP